MILNLAGYFISLYYWKAASVDKIRKMQLRKFREIFEYARQNSKFYREYYGDHGVLDLKINSFDDIKKVPVVNKAILRQYSTRDLMTCDTDESINIHSTSGSSGEPFKIAFNKFEDYTAHLRVFWALRKAGYKPADGIIMLSRYEKDHTFDVEKDLTTIRKFQNFLGIFKREIISIYEPVDIIIGKLQRSKARVLWSTPSILQIVCNRMQEKNIHLNFPIIFFTSEMITPIQKKLFETCLGRYIVNLYGSMESPSLGFDFGLTGRFIIFPNSNLFEFYDLSENEKNESTGKVIITNLINKTMPIIKYDLNDIALIEEDKSFGIKYIKNIFGRQDDIVKLPNGKEFVHHHAYEMFMDFHECEMYKFVNRPNQPFTLQIKISPSSDQQIVKQIAIEKWNRHFSDVELHIEFVDGFEVNPLSGKFKNIENFYS